MSKRILIVDDEPDFTELISTLLQFHDFDTDSLTNSAQIDSVLKTHEYDLVVTDLMMPEVDGFQLISKLRENPAFQKTPVIALSAKALKDSERKFLLQNNITYIMKPFDPQSLVDQIRQLLT